MLSSLPECSADSSIPGCQAPFDELRGSTGVLRVHWKHYFEHLEALGATEAKSRWSKAKRLLQENGASYSVHGDSKGSERPWRLSPIPLLLSSHEWQTLARGIQQRARLLSFVLADIHGAQVCLAKGCVPPELVFDNPSFLRPMHGVAQRQAWLPIYGVDLVRAPDGRFLALQDSTQVPSGMGYALENRVVVARALPELLRQCNVERLFSFFRLLRDRLHDAAPHNRDAPRIALLTPGPYSSTYLEQAYLARYFGLPLVQGGDLTVRDSRVFLKTLGGLQAIDVLLRRVFDDFCDPLELRADSELGVPGLAHAARTGNVSIISPLGTGILESPAFLAYLPALCRELLGEELLLPSVPTYYCGDPTQLQLALDDFEQMVLKPVHADAGAESIFVGELLPEAQRAVRERLLAAPQRFVAQTFVPASRTPVIADGAMQSRPYVLRCFAHCEQPNDYAIMPGGLALVASSSNDFAVSMNRGARSKDVWIISDEAVIGEVVSPPANPPIELSRGGGDLPSRVADNLYWLGRYAERAEAGCRLARVIGSRWMDAASERDYAQSIDLCYLLNALRAQTQFLRAADISLNTTLDRQANELELVAAIADDTCPGSIVSALRSTLRVSHVVRDRLSHDTQRILALLEESSLHCLNSKGRGLTSLANELNRIIINLAALSGLVMESMTRGFAWRFLDMGRRLERAVTLVTLLRSTLAVRCEREPSLVEAALDVADSKMTYRRRYPAGLQAAPAVDLLLSDEANPRSVVFQLVTLAEHMAVLPSLSGVGVKSKQQRLLLSIRTEVELCDATELCAVSSTGQRDGLVDLLDRLERSLPALSDSLTETYLYHATVARHLRSVGSDPLEPPNLAGGR